MDIKMLNFLKIYNRCDIEPLGGNFASNPEGVRPDEGYLPSIGGLDKN